MTSFQPADMQLLLVSMDIKGWDDVIATFSAAPDIVREEMLAAVTEADELLLREVTDRTPDNVIGHLKDSYVTREQPLEHGAIGIVGTPKPYAAYVELGTKPHAINGLGVQSIEDWVRAKLRVPEKEVRSVAYLVSRKIRREGTKPVGMFSKAWEEQEEAVQGIFRRARDRIAVRLAGGKPV